MDDTELLEDLRGELRDIVARHPAGPVTLELLEALARLSERRVEGLEARYLTRQHQALARAFGGQGRPPVRA